MALHEFIFPAADMLHFPLIRKMGPGEGVPGRTRASSKRMKQPCPLPLRDRCMWTLEPRLCPQLLLDQAWCLSVKTPGLHGRGSYLGGLNRLEAESADKGGPEGAQVQVPVMLMHLADVGDHQPVRIMQASSEGTAVAEF